MGVDMYNYDNTEVKSLNLQNDALKLKTTEQISEEPADPSSEKWLKAVKERFWNNKEKQETLALTLEEQIKAQAIINEDQQRSLDEQRRMIEEQNKKIENLTTRKPGNNLNNYNPSEQGKFVRWDNSPDTEEEKARQAGARLDSGAEAYA